MDTVVVTVLASLVLGAPQGISFSLAAAVIVAAMCSRGTLVGRAKGMLRMGFLQASVVFSLAWLVLDEWQLVAIVWLIAAFILEAWRGQAASDHDRWGLVMRFVAALAGFALAWLSINWATTPTLIWLVAVALLAGGVFGATLRWSALPWFAGRVSRLRTFGLVAHLAICALIIVVSLV